jgi:hypothetical protein
MTAMPRFGIKDFLLLTLVVAAAAGTRFGYLITCADNARGPAPILVQDPLPPLDLKPPEGKPPNELESLVNNLKEHRSFTTLAPLAEVEEKTAHRAPGYSWLYAGLARWMDNPEPTVRWTQAVLGTLTAVFYFFFARRAFRSACVGALAGLLCAVHPFWVFNTAELNDGALTTFLLAGCLMLGARGCQTGEAFTSLLYGLALAGLALVRAALLPFAVVAVLWYLLRCRSVKRGWLCALLAFLGFANGLAPWTLRNFQTFHDVVPIADSMYLHLWMGNHPKATGGPQSDRDLRDSLPSERRKELLDETNQNKRYGMLAGDVLRQVREDPAGTLRRRFWAGQYFFFGEQLLRDPSAWQFPTTTDASLPSWLEQALPITLPVTLLLLVIFGLLGWRWSFAWSRESMPAALAAFWVPLPYVLSHAESLWGPRLPLDGVLLCYTAFALACLVPGMGKYLFSGGKPAVPPRP